MKVLITGKGGQLAWELEQSVPDNIEIVSLARQELDISNREAVKRVFSTYKPACVINAAAYTAVDKAESEKEVAYAVNHFGAKNIAEACLEHRAKLLHVSTDFVFDGNKTTPYQPGDEANPLGVYGDSKLTGELAVLEACPNATIVRTAWVYSVNGNNFVKTMLRLMSEKEQLGIIYDQVGTPTWAAGLAALLWNMTSRHEASGVFHWTDAGVASWYDFAVAIQDIAIDIGLISKSIPISPIPTEAYPTPAKRPAFSILDKTDAERVSELKTIHWRSQLKSMLIQLKANAL